MWAFARALIYMHPKVYCTSWPIKTSEIYVEPQGWAAKLRCTSACNARERTTIRR